MKRLCGLLLFSFGFGMGVMLFLHINFCTILLILGCMLAGYYLFCCGK